VSFLLRKILSFAGFFLWWLQRPFKKKTSGKMVILPHEGLGDLIGLINAFFYLSKKEGEITVLCDQDKWAQLVETFEGLEKIKIRHFVGDKSYRLPTQLFLECDRIFALGHYSKFPIFNYPNSFYLQLNVPKTVSRNKLILKARGCVYDLPQNFLFVDLLTSTGVKDLKLDGNIAIVRVLDFRTLNVEVAERSYKIYLNPTCCFAEKIHIALKATRIICSDAALFNALVRLESIPSLTVSTRLHKHSHDKKIYKGVVFDGGVHQLQ
jgi:hypothetical protein